MNNQDEEKAILETVTKIAAVLTAAEKVGEELEKEKGEG